MEVVRRVFQRKSTQERRKESRKSVIKGGRRRGRGSCSGGTTGQNLLCRERKGSILCPGSDRKN